MLFSRKACFGAFSLVFTVFCASLPAQTRWPADLSRLVVAGDSISAGVQNFSLEQDQQIHGYASVLAQQAGVPLILPLVPYPGAPNTLELTSLNPITIVLVPGTLPAIPRVNPCEQPTNVSVPGVTLGQALSVTPAPGTSPVQEWANIVLGFPNPLGAAAGCAVTAGPLTEIQQAVALKPTAVVTWLGNNDVLVPAMIGALNLMTSSGDFATQYATLLKTLASTNAPILTANIPDVTLVPFFTPISAIAAQANLPVDIVASKLGVGPNDLLRPTAVAAAIAMLQGGSFPYPAPSQWPSACPAPGALQLLTPEVPCVLTVSDAATIRNTVNGYNLTIALESAWYGAPVVDIYGLVENLSQNGYKADGRQLTTAMLGGLFSLDGVHPSNTGYGIIANAFIDTMNTWWGTNIKKANINEIAAHDPLRPPIKLNKQP